MIYLTYYKVQCNQTLKYFKLKWGGRGGGGTIEVEALAFNDAMISSRKIKFMLD